MDLNKLMPLLVLAAIGWHSKGALQKRVERFTGIQATLVAEHDMSGILRQAKLAAYSDENFTIPNLKEFVHGHMERGLDGSDPSIDPWGRPYRHEIRNGRFTLRCAGADQAWGTDDDIERSEFLSAF